LTPLQERILRCLAGISPPWTLTGGGALAGFHTAHRTTRDLDFFWRGRAKLEDLPERVKERLLADGLEVEGARSAPSFHRMSVTDGKEMCLVDLVSEPAPALLPPDRVPLGPQHIAVDSAHEILVNKLCALLGRAEIRDLFDLEVLLERGGDLERALRDAPQRDGGFSSLTLAWVLKGLRVTELARSERMEEATIKRLDAFHERFVRQLTSSSKP
jgi:hypothetical protein